MMLTILLLAATPVPPEPFNVTDWRLKTALDGWLSCVVQAAAEERRNFDATQIDFEGSIAVAERRCWVMRYAVRDALPDTFRAELIAAGVGNPQIDVVDTLVAESMTATEKLIHMRALTKSKP